MTDDTDPVARLHEALAATETLPVETRASRWLGEAQAITADLVEANLPEDVTRERVGHVRDLLAHVDGTGNDEADAHVATAREAVADLLEDA